jgi:nucleotide-binding universal stress UspA family protein
MRRILVATDGSPAADCSVDLAAALAKASDGTLLIVTVEGNLPNHEARELARAEGSIGDALEAFLDRVLAQARERARRVGAANIQIQTCWGDAAEAIIETAQRENVEAVVLGRRGRGRLTRLLLGSVSQNISRSS